MVTLNPTGNRCLFAVFLRIVYLCSGFIFISGCGGVISRGPTDDEFFERIGIDYDADHVYNAFDNCPNIANPTQADLDYDGSGDMCDVTVDWRKGKSGALGKMRLMLNE